MNAHLKVGIVGGAGEMGRWFVRFFSERGMPVVVADPGDPSALTCEQLVSQSDAVIFSVPIGRTVAAIEAAIPYARKEQIWMDLTSIKQPAMAAMLRSPAEVLGLHPMFGPQTKSMESQIVVFCEGRPGPRGALFERLFLEAGAQIKRASAAEHDRMMAVIQGLTHFTSIVTARCLEQLGFDLSSSMQYASPIYRMRMQMVGRILAQSPQLYAEIESHNPAVPAVLREFIKSSEELCGIIERQKTEKFVEYFNSAAKYLGTFCDEALAESERLIELRGMKKDGA